MFLSGLTLAAAGTVIVLFMPLSSWLELPLLLAWLMSCLRELWQLACAASRIRVLRVDAGGRIRGIGRDGQAEPLTLKSGSMVLDRIAWLRLRFPDGLSYGELLSGHAGRDREWHRLQLIWRHRRQSVGRQQGS